MDQNKKSLPSLEILKLRMDETAKANEQWHKLYNYIKPMITDKEKEALDGVNNYFAMAPINDVILIMSLQGEKLAMVSGMFMNNTFCIRCQKELKEDEKKEDK
jgi:hypothetical protein